MLREDLTAIECSRLLILFAKDKVKGLAAILKTAHVFIILLANL